MTRTDRTIDLSDRTPLGRVWPIVAAWGTVSLLQTVTLGAEGYPVSVSDPFGHTLTFNYNTSSFYCKLPSITLPGGEPVAFAFNASNNLTSATWSGGLTRTYHYVFSC